MGKHDLKKTKRRFEFSKLMAVIAISMWLFVNLFCMVMVIFTFDTSPLMYVVPSVDAVVAVVCGYYFWKAKAENQIKLRKIYGVDVNMTDGTGDYRPPVSDEPVVWESANIV